jgi:transcriptional regulator with XRE-family HTH domain
MPAPTHDAYAQQIMNAKAGDLLREWRQRRRLSQLDLAIAANVSARHLSFVETGRSRPTSEMILHLAEQLDVPLRDRNALLLAGGYAPRYQERGLAEPELKAVRSALQLVLAGQQPYPAVVVNRWWELVEANAGIALFTRDVAPGLLEPPVNVLRLSLHPDGMAPRIANHSECRAHLLTRLHRQAETTGDPRLAALRDELEAYPGGESAPPRTAPPRTAPPRTAPPRTAPPGTAPPGTADVVVPLRYRGDRQELSFLSITAVIGTPMDITVEELAVESFYPADEATAAALAR